MAIMEMPIMSAQDVDAAQLDPTSSPKESGRRRCRPRPPPASWSPERAAGDAHALGERHQLADHHQTGGAAQRIGHPHQVEGGRAQHFAGAEFVRGGGRSWQSRPASIPRVCNQPAGSSAGKRQSRSSPGRSRPESGTWRASRRRESVSIAASGPKIAEPAPYPPTARPTARPRLSGNHLAITGMGVA